MSSSFVQTNYLVNGIDLWNYTSFPKVDVSLTGITYNDYKQYTLHTGHIGLTQTVFTARATVSGTYTYPTALLPDTVVFVKLKAHGTTQLFCDAYFSTPTTLNYSIYASGSVSNIYFFSYFIIGYNSNSSNDTASLYNSKTINGNNGVGGDINYQFTQANFYLDTYYRNPDQYLTYLPYVYSSPSYATDASLSMSFYENINTTTTRLSLYCGRYFVNMGATGTTSFNLYLNDTFVNADRKLGINNYNLEKILYAHIEPENDASCNVAITRYGTKLTTDLSLSCPYIGVSCANATVSASTWRIWMVCYENNKLFKPNVWFSQMSATGSILTNEGTDGGTATLSDTNIVNTNSGAKTYGKDLSFNGTTTYVDMPIFSPTKGHTICFWTKQLAYTKTGNQVIMEIGNPNCGIVVYHENYNKKVSYDVSYGGVLYSTRPVIWLSQMNTSSGLINEGSMGGVCGYNCTINTITYKTNGQSLFFNNNYLTIPFVNLFTTGFSLSCWVYPTSFANNNDIIFSSSGNSVNDNNFLWICLNGGNTNSYISLLMRSTTTTSTTVSLSSSVLLNLSTWYHIGVTYNSTTHEGKIYINGVFNTSSINYVNNFVNYIIDGTPSSKIGQNRTGGSPLFAYLDDYRLYDRVLNANEITDIYNNSTSTPTQIWQHVCLTHSTSGNVSLYTNGMFSYLKPNIPYYNTSLSTYSRLGAIVNTKNLYTPAYMYGEIDDVRIYDSVLLHKEIYDIYQLSYKGDTATATTSTTTTTLTTNYFVKNTDIVNYYPKLTLQTISAELITGDSASYTQSSMNSMLQVFIDDITVASTLMTAYATATLTCPIRTCPFDCIVYTYAQINHSAIFAKYVRTSNMISLMNMSGSSASYTNIKIMYVGYVSAKSYVGLIDNTGTTDANNVLPNTQKNGLYGGTIANGGSIQSDTNLWGGSFNQYYVDLFTYPPIYLSIAYPSGLLYTPKYGYSLSMWIYPYSGNIQDSTLFSLSSVANNTHLIRLVGGATETKLVLTNNNLITQPIIKFSKMDYTGTTILTNDITTGLSGYIASSALIANSNPISGMTDASYLTFNGTDNNEAQTCYGPVFIPSYYAGFSISLWFKNNAPPGSSRLFSLSNTSSTNYADVYLANGSLEYIVNNNGTDNLTTPISYSTANNWMNFVLTHKMDGTLNIYINNVNVLSTTIVYPTFTPTNFSIGQKYYTPPAIQLQPRSGGYNTYNGFIDDFRVYDKVLSVGEIYIIYKLYDYVSNATSFDVSVNQWQNVAITHDASSSLVSYYRNGVFKNSGTIPYPTTVIVPDKMYLGYTEGNNYIYKSRVQYFNWYNNCVLNASNILNTYNSYFTPMILYTGGADMVVADITSGGQVYTQFRFKSGDGGFKTKKTVNMVILCVGNGGNGYGNGSYSCGGGGGGVYQGVISVQPNNNISLKVASQASDNSTITFDNNNYIYSLKGSSKLFDNNKKSSGGYNINGVLTNKNTDNDSTIYGGYSDANKSLGRDGANGVLINTVGLFPDNTTIYFGGGGGGVDSNNNLGNGGYGGGGGAGGSKTLGIGGTNGLNNGNNGTTQSGGQGGVNTGGGGGSFGGSGGGGAGGSGYIIISILKSDILGTPVRY